MNRSLALVLLGLLIASPAAAQTHTLVILPFTGPNGAVSRGQFVEALCGGEVTCIPWKRAVTGTEPDFGKARNAGVGLILTGGVTGAASQRELKVSGHGPDGEVRFEASHPLARNGKVSRSSLSEVRTQVLDAFAAEVQRVAENEQQLEEPAPVAEAATPPPSSPEPVGDIRILPLLPPERLFFVELGTDFTNRNFQYVGLAEQNLRAYETRPLMFAPRLQGGVYPLALLFDGLPARIGIEAGYAFAVGLRSMDENDRPHTTTFRELDVGARVDLYPFGATKPMISPQVGYRSSTFSVGASPDGSRLQGLPDLDYDLLRAGVEVEAPFGAMSVFGRANYLHALGLGEIGSDAYFPRSGGNGLELEIGGGYAIASNLQLRLAAHYTRYGLSFDADPGAVYRAEGAADQYVGGTLGLRFVY